MFNQKLQSAELMEWVFEDETYDTDPCELKLDEMIEAEPEPEMIEGMPASDALSYHFWNSGIVIRHKPKLWLPKRRTKKSN